MTRPARITAASRSSRIMASSLSAIRCALTFRLVLRRITHHSGVCPLLSFESGSTFCRSSSSRTIPSCAFSAAHDSGVLPLLLFESAPHPVAQVAAALELHARYWLPTTAVSVHHCPPSWAPHVAQVAAAL